MSWYFKALAKFGVFSGRAHRKEYWYFFLFNALICFALGVIEGVLGLFPDTLYSVLGTVYALLALTPALAVFVRRLHDTDHSAWWLLILFVPVVGFLFWLTFVLEGGTPGENRYGPDPRSDS